MPHRASRTIQLRRYVIQAGLLDEFVEWWDKLLVPARLAHGYKIEFAYAVPETNEFVWAVSLPVDEEHFSATEAVYQASPERAQAWDGQPNRIESQVLTLVTPLR